MKMRKAIGPRVTSSRRNTTFIVILATFLVSLIVLISVISNAPLAAQTLRSVWDGVYTKEQATRGALTSGLCTQCHGDSFQGDPAPPLTGPDFLAKWDGRSVGDLFELIRQTMPDDDPGALSGQQYADLLAYIFSLNKFPVGSTELANQAEPLKEIRFEAKK